jgi:predicted DNA repair protein MutK
VLRFVFAENIFATDLFWRCLLAGTSLLALIDDIATLLDDVAVMSKVAVKKTAGVLGDDLALNAEQVTGVNPDRELPVVWAVAKGSFVNKLILVPAALAISYFLPVAIIPLLMLGGLFLCFEGCEKLAHKLFPDKKEDAERRTQLVQAVADPKVDLLAFENEKIKGAVRTDFILSAEIVVITLGTLTDSTMTVRIATLCSIAIFMTVGVYGLVAAIVKLDDLGLKLLKTQGAGSQLKHRLGKSILLVAPVLMKTLGIVGTAAMFMVGGGILVHGIGPVHHFVQDIAKSLAEISYVGGFLSVVGSIALEAGFGILCGLIALFVFIGFKKLKKPAAVKA